MNQMVTEFAAARGMVDAGVLTPAYPTTILTDTRPGQMRWVAVPFDDIEFPDWNDPDDVADFWAELEGEPVGRGATPNAAVAAMHAALDARGGFAEYEGAEQVPCFIDTWGR